MRIRRRLLLFAPSVLAALILALGAATPSAPAPALYKPAAGPLHPVTKSTVLRDSKRNKDLPVNIVVPTGRGRYPVIVFSHGAGGSGASYTKLTTFWASHGYVVLLPTHADSISLTAPGRPGRGMLQALDAALNDPNAWQQRPRDIAFLLDSLDALETKMPELKGRMDRTRIGMGGHSFGAQTTVLIGGATIDLTPNPSPSTERGDHTGDLPSGKTAQSFADRRPRALLVLSGQGSGQMGFTPKSWGRITRPMLTMTGTRDSWSPTRGPAWRKEPFTGAPAGDKFHILIDGASHMAFTGLESDITPRSIEIFTQVQSATLCFWDAFLKADSKALAYLRSTAFPTATNGKVHLDRK